MANTERPIIIDLGSRRRSDIRDLKRGAGELAYEVDRVLERVQQEFGQQGQQGQQGGGSGGAGVGISAGVSTSSGAGAGISAQASGGQRIQPVIVLYRERSSSRGGFMSMFDDDDDDDRDRDRD